MKIKLEDFEYEVPNNSKVIGIIVEDEEGVILAIQEERLQEILK